MTHLQDREQAFEKKFVKEEEKEFKAKARRNIRLAQWAAGELGLEGQKKEDYADAVFNEYLQKELELLVARLQSDLSKKDIEVSEKELLKKAEQLLAEARKEIEKDGK